MLKVACDEVLGSGAVLWFQNPQTNDIHAGIDGSDNQNLMSWFAVREGVAGFPTALNHLDLWLNYSYKRAELEGFVTLKDSSEDGWDYKEKEVLARYNAWRKTAILGRIGSDAGVLNMVNPTGSVGKTQEVLEQLLDKGLIVDDTTLYVNNCHLGKISDLFKGEEPVFGRFAKMFVSAQEEPLKFPEFAPDAPAAKPTAPHDAKLKALREQYKALPDGSPEQGALLKETMTALMGSMSPSDKESYFPALYKIVAPYLESKDPSQRPMEAAGLIWEKILVPVAESFLSKWEPDGGRSISSYIIGTAQDYAKSNINRPGKDRYTTLTKDGIDKLESLQVPEEVISKLSSLQNTELYSGPDQLMRAISKVLTPEEMTQFGDKIRSVFKGRIVDRQHTVAPSRDDRGNGGTQSFNPIDISTTDYSGQERESDPRQQAISGEDISLLNNLPNLSPIEKFVIDSRYFQGLTLDQTAEQLAKQNPEKGVLTKERIRQIEKKVLTDLKQRLVKKFPEMGEDVARIAEKKIFLSTAHQKANGG